MLLRITDREQQRLMQHKHAFTSSISPLRVVKEDGQQTMQRAYGGTTDKLYSNEARASSIEAKKRSIQDEYMLKHIT